MDLIEYYRPLFLFGWTVPIVIGVIIYLVRKRNIILDIEKDKNPVYSENCRGKFGVFLNTPFVRFAIYNEFIVISYSKKILLRFDEIDKVGFRTGFVLDRIRFYHHKTDIPSNIIIMSTNSDKIRRIIESKFDPAA